MERDDPPTPDPVFVEALERARDTPVVGEVFTHSLGIEKLAAALAQAQLKYEPLKATQTADAEKYRYQYADLAGVLASVQPALAGQGIAILQGVSMQRPQGSSGLVVLVETRLLHQSGQWIATTLKLPSGEVMPQKVGSLITYLRRYGLLAMAGVASEDDDGKQATEAQPPKPTRMAPPKTQPATAQPVAKPVAVPPPAAQPDRTLGDTPTSAFASTKDRGLLFKVAKASGFDERQVKQLIFALWGYTSTGQIHQGAELGKLLSAMENPGDHGVTRDGEDIVYTREADPNAIGNADLGGL